MSGIKNAWIATNYSCNMRCKWCYAVNSLSSEYQMPIETAKQIVDTLYDIGVKRITLIGGEPTLYSEIITLISYIKNRTNPSRIGLSSNGVRMSDRRFAQELMSAGLDGCNISIKGLSEKDYSDNTGFDGGCGRMLEGYHNMKDLGCKVITSYVISRAGTDQIEQLYDFCHANDIDRVLLQFVKPSVQLSDSSVMPMKEMARITEFIYRFWKDGIKYKVEISYPVCLIENDIYENMCREGRITGGCHVQTGSGINYDVKGRIIPCNHFDGIPYADDPQTTESSVNELRSGELYDEVRKKACSFPSKKCKGCRYWNKCGGGCFTRWFYENPGEIIG